MKPINKGCAEPPERLKPIRRPDLGATCALTTIAPANDARPYHENFEFHRRRLGEIGEALAPFKMQLGVEFLAPAEHPQRSCLSIHSLVRCPLVMLVSMARATNVWAVADAWQIMPPASSPDDLRS